MAITRRTSRKVPATPRNLALDARRKKKFEKDFERWEKKVRAAMKKKPCKHLQIYLDQLRPMVHIPIYGFLLIPSSKKGRGGRR